MNTELNTPAVPRPQAIDLELPRGYTSRAQVTYFDDIPSERVYQPSVYALAAKLQKRGSIPYIIDIGCGTANGASRFLRDSNYIGVDYGANLARAKKNMPHGDFYEHDLERPLTLSAEVLEHAIIICADVVEHVADPTVLLQSLADMAKFAPYVLISTPDRERCRGMNDMGPPANRAHVREWSCGEFTRLLQRMGFDNALTGFTLDNTESLNKTTILAISGTQTRPRVAPAKRALAIVSCYNDADIIIETTRHLIEQGVFIHFLDNWSTDITWTLLEKLKSAFPQQIVTLERFPADGPSDSWSWHGMLQRKHDISMEAPFDWFFHYDSDELRVSPWPGITLAQAINFVDSLGYNAIDHTVLNFRATRDGFDAKKSPEEFFTHFEFAVNSSDHCQIKGWAKRDRPFDLTSSGGHQAEFDERKVFPLNFLNKHYSLRSTTHAQTKLFTERAQRTAKEKSERGWHRHYERYAHQAIPKNFIWPAQFLTPYTEHQFNQEFLVERLSNIDAPCPWRSSPVR